MGNREEPARVLDANDDGIIRFVRRIGLKKKKRSVKQSLKSNSNDSPMRLDDADERTDGDRNIGRFTVNNVETESVR